MTQGNKKQPPHYVGHRKRLKEKFLKADPAAFNDYELLELLLFQSTPRKDVKPLAKQMLQEFGDFNQLINAERKKILAIDEATESSFLQIRIIKELINRVFQDRIRNTNIISSWSALLEYLKFNMGCLKLEQFRVLFLNKKNMLLADEVMANGGDVLGVTTKHLDQYEVGHTGVTELKIADDMHARKNMMFEEADGFIIMPGGFGTLEELFEVITWKQIGLHDKPIVVVNVDGFWDPLKNLMDTIIKKKFASATDDAIVCFVDKVEDAVSTLVDAPRVSINPSKKWVRE